SPPPTTKPDPAIFLPLPVRVITRSGERRLAGRAGCYGRQSCLCERPPCPGEAIAVPALELRQGDAAARGVDEPAAAHVDPGVVDLRRPRVRAVEAEEDDVGRLELREGNPLGARDLPAHSVGRSSAQDVGECALAVVALELVHAPDEAGAVEAATRLDAEGRLGALARAAPDVRVADEGEGGGEDAALPRRQRRENERRGRGLDGGNLAAAEAEDARRGIGRLGPGGGVGGAELEVVLGGGMVVSKAEQASRDFGAEA